MLASVVATDSRRDASTRVGHCQTVSVAVSHCDGLSVEKGSVMLGHDDTYIVVDGTGGEA